MSSEKIDDEINNEGNNEGSKKNSKELVSTTSSLSVASSSSPPPNNNNSSSSSSIVNSINSSSSNSSIRNSTGEINPFGPAIGIITLKDTAVEYSHFVSTSNKPTVRQNINYQRGTLYVATKATCFRSTNFIGIETCRVIIPWRDVRFMERSKEVDNGMIIVLDVCINTKKNGGSNDNDDDDDDLVRHEFRFGQTDECEAALEALEAARDGRKFMTSASSLPAEPNNNNANNNNTSVVSLPANGAQNNELGETEEDYLAACTVAAMADFRTISLAMKSSRKLLDALDDNNNTNTPSPSHQANKTISNDQRNDDPTSKKEEEKKKKDGDDDDDGLSSDEDMEKAWKELKEAKEPTFKEIVVKDLFLPCTVETFFSKFLADDAPYSFENYMAGKGDVDIKTSKWSSSTTKNDDNTTNNNNHNHNKMYSFQSRDIQYNHPVNAPMAPPIAQATKRQRLMKFSNPNNNNNKGGGGRGLCLDTRTVVDDVPLTDCFLVDDRILVDIPKIPPNGILLTIRFQIRFVKSTMFRRIIENTSRGEFIKFYRGFITMVEQSFQNEKEEDNNDNEDDNKATAATTTATTTTTTTTLEDKKEMKSTKPDIEQQQLLLSSSSILTKWSIPIMIGLLLCMFLMNTFMVQRLMTINHSMVLLEHQFMDMNQKNKVLWEELLLLSKEETEAKK